MHTLSGIFFIVFVFLSSLYNHLEKWWVLKGCPYNPPPFQPLFTHPTLSPPPSHPHSPTPPCALIYTCPDPRLWTKTKVVGRFNCIVTCDSCNLLPQNVAPICSVQVPCGQGKQLVRCGLSWYVPLEQNLQNGPSPSLEYRPGGQITNGLIFRTQKVRNLLLLLLLFFSSGRLILCDGEIY